MLFNIVYAFLVIITFLYLTTAIFVFVSNVNILRRHGFFVLKYLLSGTFLWPIHFKNLGFRKYFAFYFQNKIPQEFNEAQYNRRKDKVCWDKAIYWVYCSRASDHSKLSLESFSEKVRKLLPKNFNVILIIGWIPTIGFKYTIKFAVKQFNADIYKNRDLINCQFLELENDQGFDKVEDCIKSINTQKITIPKKMIDKMNDVTNKYYQTMIYIFQSEWFEKFNHATTLIR